MNPPQIGDVEDRPSLELLPALLFLDNVHLALCADQMKMVDEHGGKLGNFYLDAAKKLLPSIEQKLLEDHVLHPLLKYITIKMRILLQPQNSDSLRVMKRLYRLSKKYSRNCDKNTIYCFCAVLYIERVYLSVVLRFGEVENRNETLTRMRVMLDEYPQHKEHSFAKLCSSHFDHCMTNLSVEKNDVIQADLCASKMLESKPNPVMKSIALQYQAVVRLNTPQTFLTTQEIDFIQQKIEAARKGNCFFSPPPP